jgi:hypothetical protein
MSNGRGLAQECKKLQTSLLTITIDGVTQAFPLRYASAQGKTRAYAGCLGSVTAPPGGGPLQPCSFRGWMGTVRVWAGVVSSDATLLRPPLFICEPSTTLLRSLPDHRTAALALNLCPRPIGGLRVAALLSPRAAVHAAGLSDAIPVLLADLISTTKVCFRHPDGTGVPGGAAALAARLLRLAATTLRDRDGNPAAGTRGLNHTSSQRSTDDRVRLESPSEAGSDSKRSSLSQGSHGAGPGDAGAAHFSSQALVATVKQVTLASHSDLLAPRRQ